MPATGSAMARGELFTRTIGVGGGTLLLAMTA